MKLQNRPDLLYSIGKILFSIPVTAFCAILMALASPALSIRLGIITCLAAFVFSGYETVISAVRAVVRRRFLHPDIFATAACGATMALGLWQEGALGMAVYAACRSIIITEREDTRNSVTYDSDLPGYSEDIHRKLLAMDQTPAPVERSVKKAGALFSVLLVIVILALTVVVPLMWRLTYRVWLRRAFILLAGACPGALAFAASNVFYKNLNLGAVHGVLYRNRGVLQKAAGVTSVVLSRLDRSADACTVSGCCPAGIAERELLLLAAYACAGYSDAMYDALCSSGEAPDLSLVSEERVYPGKGVVKSIRGMEIAAGTRQMMEEFCAEVPEGGTEDSVLHVACGGKYAGYLRFSGTEDCVNDATVSSLHGAGIDRIVLLSTEAAQQSARPEERGVPLIREAFSGLTEEEAVRKMSGLQQMQMDGELLAYVNDGVSSPELMDKADIRISVGTAPEVSRADIVVPGTDTASVAAGLKLCREARSEVTANLIVCGLAKLLILVLSLAGWGGIWSVVLVDMVSSLIVIPGVLTVFGRGKVQGDGSGKDGGI